MLLHSSRRPYCVLQAFPYEVQLANPRTVFLVRLVVPAVCLSCTMQRLLDYPLQSYLFKVQECELLKALIVLT